MKEIVIFIWGVLLASGWWATGIWGIPEKGFLVPAFIGTLILSIAAFVFFLVHIITHWQTD